MAFRCVEPGHEVDPTVPHYIFGYGSLIEDESRMRTTPSARDAYPVLVGNIRRGWFARGASSGMTTTYLGAIERDGHRCNGVIYRASAEEINATDHRESAGYRRCEIPTEFIRVLDGRSEPLHGQVWAYLNHLDPGQLDDNAPSAQFPMVQSYVDICVNGCIEVDGRYPAFREQLGPSFTEAFFETTTHWGGPESGADHVYWVNDRLYPRRPFIYEPNAGAIDAAIRSARKTADMYYEVELEPASWEQPTPVRPVDERPAPHAPVPRLAAWARGG